MLSAFFFLYFINFFEPKNVLSEVVRGDLLRQDVLFVILGGADKHFEDFLHLLDSNALAFAL